MADEEGLLPILAWIKRLCDHVIHLLGAENLEFVWGRESVADPTIQRENLVAYVGAGMMTRRRAAEILGETLPDDPMADVLTVTTGQGVVTLGSNSPTSDVEKRYGRFSALGFDALKIEKFDPDQPRDENGRWASTTGAPAQIGSSTTMSSHGGAQPQTFTSANSSPLPKVAAQSKEACIAACSDIALPTPKGSQGVAIFRCMQQCMGEADWPEWRKHFPSPASQAERPHA
jgi:hypothetical protein